MVVAKRIAILTAHVQVRLQRKFTVNKYRPELAVIPLQGLL